MTRQLATGGTQQQVSLYATVQTAVSSLSEKIHTNQRPSLNTLAQAPRYMLLTAKAFCTKDLHNKRQAQ